MDQNKEPPRVVFEEENVGWKAMKYYREPTTPKIIDWVMKYSGGAIKDEKQANYVLIGFVSVAIIVFLMVIFSGRSKIPSSPPTPFQESNF